MLALFEGVWSFAVDCGKKRKTKTAAVFAEAGRAFPPSDVPELRLRSRKAHGAVKPWAFALPPASGFRKSEKGGFSFGHPGVRVPSGVRAVQRFSPLNVPGRGTFPFKHPGGGIFPLNVPEIGDFPFGRIGAASAPPQDAPGTRCKPGVPRFLRRPASGSPKKAGFSFGHPGGGIFPLNVRACGTFPSGVRAVQRFSP